jgi:hypothetical protein
MPVVTDVFDIIQEGCCFAIPVRVFKYQADNITKCFFGQELLMKPTSFGTT